MWLRAVALALGLLLVPSIASAQPWQPGPHARGDETIIGFIDVPRPGEVIEQGTTLTIFGWVVDSATATWAGIDEVHLYRGTAADQYLGRAEYGNERADVASHFGNPSWRNSGFRISVDTSNLSPGDHTLSVYAHTPQRGWWSRSVTVRIVPGATPEPETDSETVEWQTPRNHTITTVASLREPLERLARTPWGNWGLDIAAASEGLEVRWSRDLGERFSLYQYGTRVILVNARYRDADQRVLATAIAHELQQAIDDVLGWAVWRAIQCPDLKARAFLAQSATWNAFYGPFGKVQAVDELEEAHNAVLEAVTARPGTWLEDASAAYRSRC